MSKIKNPYIVKILNVSTGHLSFPESETLTHEANEGNAPVYDIRESGWIVYTGDPDENWQDVKMSEQFFKILKAAGALECSYVWFDRDGNHYEEFETFDW